MPAIITFIMSFDSHRTHEKGSNYSSLLGDGTLAGGQRWPAYYGQSSGPLCSWDGAQGFCPMACSLSTAPWSPDGQVRSCTCRVTETSGPKSKVAELHFKVPGEGAPAGPQFLS